MFDSIQLIPASSGYDMHSAQKDRAHLPNIKKDTGVEYRDMLFFDDESPNIVKVSRLQMPWHRCGLQHPYSKDAAQLCQLHLAWKDPILISKVVQQVPVA